MPSEAAGARGGEAASGCRGCPFVERFPVHVAHALPRRDAGEMGRLLRGDVPLGDGQRRGAGHGHAPVAPGLLRGPLDHVVAVFGLLLAELVVEALRVADAAGVDVDDRIPVGAPEKRIGRLELGAGRDGAERHARRVAHVLACAEIVRALPVVRPGQDRRHLRVRVLRPEDVAVEGDSVAHLDRHVLLAHDAGRRLVRALVERIGLGQLLFLVGQGLPLLGRDGPQLLLVYPLYLLTPDGGLEGEPLPFHRHHSISHLVARNGVPDLVSLKTARPQRRLPPASAGKARSDRTRLSQRRASSPRAGLPE